MKGAFQMPMEKPAQKRKMEARQSNLAWFEDNTYTYTITYIHNIHTYIQVNSYTKRKLFTLQQKIKCLKGRRTVIHTYLHTYMPTYLHTYIHVLIEVTSNKATMESWLMKALSSTTDNSCLVEILKSDPLLISHLGLVGIGEYIHACIHTYTYSKHNLITFQNTAMIHTYTVLTA